jgi:hypothetical protein
MAVSNLPQQLPTCPLVQLQVVAVATQATRYLKFGTPTRHRPRHWLRLSTPHPSLSILITANLICVHDTRDSESLLLCSAFSTDSDEDFAPAMSF